MAVGNACLQVKLADLVTRGGLVQMRQSALDHGPVPARAVLLRQKQQIAFGIHARRKARAGQKHQRQQRLCFRTVARGMLHEQRR